MAKRALESLSMAGGAAKISRIEIEKIETVVDKKFWRINNKECYCIIIRQNNMVSDRSVIDKKVYNEINVNSTYKFTYQIIKGLLYIVDHTMIELKYFVTRDDFALEKLISLYLFIVCAYEVRDYGNNSFSTIKVCTIIKREQEFVQCDLFINLDTLITFDIELHDDNATRVTKALKCLYELKDSWCVAQVSCIKNVLPTTVYYNLLLFPHSTITELEPGKEVHTDRIGNQFPNISYLNKVFRCVEVLQLTCTLTDFVHRVTNKVNKLFKITLETKGSEKINATAFINNMKQEECEEGLQAVNINVANGDVIYAIVTNKHGEQTNICLTSIVTYSKSKNEFYSLFY
ncbi:LEF-3 [Pseudalatia unipuncta granulovirus]|uniref:LEF-3 n=1 Tax=Pseudalatia unipuncta granulosis virus TaxID=36355 RepID=B6S709_GVPU|nr:LEF-3 [Pseudalatia unipuncta granulovirus]ACH69490.1 LEF-3 [Pseudalatia unipuncta granulovirus]